MALERFEWYTPIGVQVTYDEVLQTIEYGWGYTEVYCKDPHGARVNLNLKYENTPEVINQMAQFLLNHMNSGKPFIMPTNINGVSRDYTVVLNGVPTVTQDNSKKANITFKVGEVRYFG
ncbi:hypothetical protein [Psittacicella hinzii]|uniref:Phage tail protein n=1 Tax=Psittacicella hinzii TaxID=2028575 RepID=A0A3A1YQF2_9GAMM|nr:hypothetical protein [Psittacicella hinzii]RIY39479.1 hypothetical protein CKF58_02120 [Psittacicella hinzii]